jgi:asparagine synthase (glutamine-hydrolysing)
MCGIAVAINWEDAEATVGRLIAGLMHRGDITDPPVSPRPYSAMATRRLRIVDGADAVQPQPSFDNRLLVSLNGEIYNHIELRQELEAAGISFRTGSDTEVLASGLAAWGPRLLQRLNGMYAFVAIDVGTGEFLAARDPFGVKPLYLMQSGDGFLFCSEIRPLLAAEETGDVLLLPPGHLLTRTQLLPFHSFIANAAKATTEHAPQVLDRLLAKAVQARLPADLPVATTFSGGIDSTLVTHYARQLRPETPGYFLGDSRAPDYAYAARYADDTGLDMREVPFDLGQRDTLAQIGDVVAAAETFEPGDIRTGLCNYVLSRRMHEDGYRVALCGEGADELFAGYVPLELAFADSDAAGDVVRDQCVALMQRTSLQRLDRCSMRFELEVRDPFLDPKVVAYALSLGAAGLLDSVDGKWRGKAPLRALWSLHPDRLPVAIRDRRKTPLNEGSGFDQSQTVSPWIAFAEEAISDSTFREGQRRFAAFDLRSKEELLYLDRLATTLDVSRVPHLKSRTRLQFPALSNRAANAELLKDYVVAA